jgi:DNA-binding NarL/FixJ family response regulator
MASLEAVSAVAPYRGGGEKAMFQGAEIDGRRGWRETSQIRVLVADDHAMVREGIVEMLSLNEDVEVVGQAGNGHEAVEMAGDTGPDVVILDVEMPGMGAQGTLKQLLKLSPTPKIVIVTVFADRRLVRELLGLGASAFLAKSASSRDLLAAVRSVAHVPLGTPDTVTVTVPREDYDAEEPTESPLSRREAQVLRLVARGGGNREVADSLHLSESTVKRHLSNVYDKLGVNTRGEAVSRAVSEGWISSWDIAKDE